ncbi:MAG TPA: o-succinylbenzoate synthase [Planctomycetaceae bacterium]|nr:o-succinylbenzoate synthase [Planctomycetaceae bacterium]
MRIDRIDLYHVAMPLIYPWRTAYGEDATIESVLCRLTSGSLTAWGEASPLAAPCYSPEWAGGVFAVCRDWFGPALLHQDIDSGDALQQRLSLFKGNPFGKAVFDTAWWNLEAQRTGKTVSQLLGATRDSFPVGADFGVMDSVDDLLPCVADAVAKNFRRTKLKFRPGWDLPMLRAVRDAFPSAVIHIDCNSGYRLDDLPMFQEIDELNLAMIEQPLRHDDLVDHATLQRAITTPVCLDESISGLPHTQQALALKSCQYVNIKPGRVGGLTIAKKIHDACQSAGIPCWVGGMLESAIGVQTCVALGSLPNFTYPADIFPSARFYTEDLADPAIELITDAEGCPAVAVPKRLAEPVPLRLERCTRQYATLK